MPCSTKQEPPPDILFDSLSNRCCADSIARDNQCTAVVETLENRSANHTTTTNSGCRNSHCEGCTEDSHYQLLRSASAKHQSDNNQNSCCMSNKPSCCTSKKPSSSSSTDCDVNQPDARKVKDNSQICTRGTSDDTSRHEGTLALNCCGKPTTTIDEKSSARLRCSSAYSDATSKPNIVDGVHDLEKNAAREHVVFKVTGMTCTGCTKKVQGVLSKVEAVHNVQVNFMASSVDMDVDTAQTSAATVLQRLEKETGFKCSRIVNDYQILDLVINSAVAKIFEANLPCGVESVEGVGKEIYRVSYDPLLIGARTVLAKSSGRLAPPNSDEAVAEGRRRFLHMLWSFAGATILTVPVCVLAFSNVPVSFLTEGIVQLVLATFVQLIAVPEFYLPALKALVFSKTIEMDMLVVISITAAYGYSIIAFGLQVSGIHLKQGTLFETSTLLITLILLGRLVASYAKVRAVQAVSLKSLQTQTALLENGQSELVEIDARLLEFNDVIRIPAHSKIVSDGQVISGESAVDESIVTGESLPVPKAAGDYITAGTLNGTGVLRIRLTRLPGKNSITDIADLVQNALNSKPHVQDLADVVAGYFVPVVVSISVAVFVVWIVIAVRLRKENAGGAIGTAITYSIAVLAISCPCAIGLAVPLVLVIAGGVAARNGIIIKQADAIERGFKVTDVVFDKTGTLTTGQLEVVQQNVYQNGLPWPLVLAVTYSLVKDDPHPVAQAVAAKLKSQNIAMEALETIQSVPGCGVHAIWKGQEAKAGNQYWLGVDASSSIATLSAKGCTVLCVTVNAKLVASFGLVASIRPEAQSVISDLQRRGLTCHIVSGDQPTAVSKVATSLDVHIDNTASRQSPADKRKYIETLSSAGKITLFVGDGTNDAVAVAAANVGVQIGIASDVTRAIADVVLLGGLEGIVTLLEVSKQSFYRIFFNFIWAGLYNLFAILFASGAFVKVRIAPNYAGLGEIVSVLPVVFIALTMLRFKVRTQ